MNFQRTYAILLRVYYLMRGSFTRVFPLFAWSAIDIILWGFITRYLSNVTHNNFNFLSTLLGAVLFWDFLTRAMFGVSTSFFEDVWSRNFLNIFASPLRVTEYLSGLVLASISTSAIGLIVMLLIATLVFGLSLFVYGIFFIPFILVLFVFGIALGIAAISIVLRFGPAAEWFIWPIPQVIAPLAAVFYPVATLPIWLQPVARLLPASYVFEGMRAMVAGKPVPIDLLVVGAALAVVDVLLACWLFNAMYKRAVRSGLIARYSAESIS